MKRYSSCAITNFTVPFQLFQPIVLILYLRKTRLFRKNREGEQCYRVIIYTSENVKYINFNWNIHTKYLISQEYRFWTSVFIIVRVISFGWTSKSLNIFHFPWIHFYTFHHLGSILRFNFFFSFNVFPC